MVWPVSSLRRLLAVPVESPPRTVQEYVMQARHSAPEPQPVRGEEADAAATSYKEATLDDAPRAPFLSPVVVPSKRAAPKEPRRKYSEILVISPLQLFHPYPSLGRLEGWHAETK